MSLVPRRPSNDRFLSVIIRTVQCYCNWAWVHRPRFLTKQVFAEDLTMNNRAWIQVAVQVERLTWEYHNVLGDHLPWVTSRLSVDGVNAWCDTFHFEVAGCTGVKVTSSLHRTTRGRVIWQVRVNCRTDHVNHTREVDW